MLRKTKLEQWHFKETRLHQNFKHDFFFRQLFFENITITTRIFTFEKIDQKRIV